MQTIRFWITFMHRFFEGIHPMSLPTLIAVSRSLIRIIAGYKVLQNFPRRVTMTLFNSPQK